MSSGRINGTAALGEVRAAIGQAATRTGVAFSYLLAQARSESGLDPTAKAQGSSAAGLYQFLDQSWLAIVKKHGAEHGLGWAAEAIGARPGGGFTVDPALRPAVMALREQAGPAALMAAAYAGDNAASLAQTLGRAANATDLYFAHFLGLGGARRFLQAVGAQPEAPAAAMFPREAGANRAIFYGKDGGARSLGEVYALMGRRLAANGADAVAPAAAGSLVATPEEAEAAALRLAATDEPPAAPAADMLAAPSRNRFDLLRPTPAQARLAYLLLSTPSA